MPRRQTQLQSLPFSTDYDLEQGKAFVRLRQAARPVPESFFTLRAGALVLQLLGLSFIALSLAAAAFLMVNNTATHALKVPGVYIAVVVAVVGCSTGLFVLVVGELLTLQVVIARNTRLSTVILSEMNYAEASAREDMARRLGQHPGESP